MNGHQLNKWLPDEFEGPIYKPLFGVGKDLQLLLCVANTICLLSFTQTSSLKNPASMKFSANYKITLLLLFNT